MFVYLIAKKSFNQLFLLLSTNTNVCFRNLAICDKIFFQHKFCYRPNSLDQNKVKKVLLGQNKNTPSYNILI